jgi:hypothetical protein
LLLDLYGQVALATTRTAVPGETTINF